MEPDDSPNETRNVEFDILRGGEVDLTILLNAKQFFLSRVDEIDHLREAIENPQRKSQIFQQLPWHLRRRVMSHSTRRVPRRLREHASLNKCDTKQPAKRPSRKYRRRPKILCSEYARRQRLFVWLETHIWHAKRFFMTSLWGYKIPLKPTDKSFRACYRAAAHHSLIQDISYHVCLELRGPEARLLEGFRKFKPLGSSLSAKPQLTGAREGHATVFSPSSGRPIGQISFIWRSDDPGNKRVLWIWAHPSFHKELFEEVKGVFSEEPSVHVELLKDELNRFRLTGPKSLGVVCSAFVPAQGLINGWAAEYVSSHCDSHRIQALYYLEASKQSSPAQLPPRSVLPTITTIVLPPSRIQPSIPEIGAEALEQAVESRDSPLWEPETRKAMKEEAQGKTDPKLGIAMIIIQRPSSPQGFGCGLDVIVGAGHGRRAWLALVHHGARASGLREAEYLSLLMCSEPQIPIDSLAGKEYADTQLTAEKLLYDKKPPSKRPNFEKLGVKSPFHCDWSSIVADWGGSDWRVARGPQYDQNGDDSGRLVRVKITPCAKGKLPACSLLCLPLKEDLQNAPRDVSRRLIGRVTNGGYSLLEGKSTAIGYVVSAALKQLQSGKLLARPVHSQQYMIASITTL